MTDSEDPKNSASNGDPELTDRDKTKTQLNIVSSGKLLPHHPKQIGKYHLRRVIASGGMGTVFEGVQETPRRSVNVLALGMYSIAKNGISSPFSS